MTKAGNPSLIDKSVSLRKNSKMGQSGIGISILYNKTWTKLGNKLKCLIMRPSFHVEGKFLETFVLRILMISLQYLFRLSKYCCKDLIIKYVISSSSLSILIEPDIIRMLYESIHLLCYICLVLYKTLI